MDTIESKKQSFAYSLLIFATFFLYIILTGAKNLYVAEKTTLQSLGTFGSFTDLAATMEYYFYAYAVMQVLLVFFMKNLNVKWFLTVTLSISAFITIFMAFTDTILSHWILYTVNGALQAGVWGCSLKILAQYLPQKRLSTATKLMSSGPAVAGIVSYGVAAIFGDDWTTPFIFLGVLLLLSIALFFLSVTNVSRFPREMVDQYSENTEKNKSESNNDFIGLNSKKRKAVFYVVSVLLGLGVTSLFFAMNNTLDIFLKQIGGFDNTTSKWITVLAPLAFVIGPILCVNTCEKHKNFIAVGAVFFGAAFLVSLLLFFLFDLSVVLSMSLLLIYLILTNGGRSISLSVAAFKLRDKIDTGVYSTLVNSAASIAAGLIPKLFTSIVDNTNLSPTQNWSNAFMVLMLVNALIFMALIGIILWVKALNKKN